MKSLTTADWRRLNRASKLDDSAAFKRTVDEIVQERMAMAWDRGFDRGWRDGVTDATRDDGGVGALNTRPRNPFRQGRAS